MGNVVGLDVSQRSSGVGVIDIDTGSAYTRLVRTTRGDGSLSDHLRSFYEATAQVIALVHHARPDLVVIESADFTPTEDSSAHRRAGIWWAIFSELARYYPVLAATPKSLKLWVAFSGAASKEEMIEAVRTVYGPGVFNDAGDPAARFVKTGAADRADALGLAGMGTEQIGGTSLFAPSPTRTEVRKKLGWIVTPEQERSAA